MDVSTTEGIPSSLINRCVCVISGEYTDSVVDVILPGPESLVLSRTYNSLATTRPWNFNHCEELQVLREDPFDHIRLRQPSGAFLDYIYKKEKDHKHQKELEFKFVVPPGLTNSGIVLSGKTNLRNQLIHYYPNDDLMQATTGAGNQKIFKKIKKNRFKQSSEKKANGSLYEYDGPANGMLGASSIVCRNKKTFSQITIQEAPYADDLFLHTLLTSDNREYKYYFKEHTYHIKEPIDGRGGDTKFWRYYLKKVDHPYAPAESYKYSTKALSKDWHITMKSRDKDRRYLKIDYYQTGYNFFGGNNEADLEKEFFSKDAAEIIKKTKRRQELSIRIKDKDDFRLDRVKRLLAPVGTTAEPIITHRFDYHAKKVKKHSTLGYKKILDGWTDVYDAYDHKTSYAYDENHRLIAITRHTGINEKTYVTYNKERFVWGEEETEEGCLLKKSIEGSDGTVLHSRTFTYDDRGNVLTSTLQGKLTGNDDIENDTTTFTYSQDGLNLLLTETDGNGKKTRYVYNNDSDILRAKFVLEDKKIRIREFYFYDENNELTKKVIDDGNIGTTNNTSEAIEEACNNLSEVTERHISIIQPRKAMPFGLPEVIEEFYRCPEMEEKAPLRKIECDYSPEGRLLEQHVHDAEGKLAYTLSWEYDLHGNVVSETNAIGETILRNYDLGTDNLIEESTLSADKKILRTLKYTYDFSNRLIEQKEIDADLQEFTKSYQYDYLSNCLAETSPFGHRTEQAFDEFGRVIEIRYPAVADEDGILTNPVIKKAYDHSGFPTCLTDALNREIHFEYNIRGQPIKITYPDGTKEEMFYELDGQLKKKISKEGICIEYTRDFLGRVILERITAGEEKKDTINQYNAFHLIKSIDPEGAVTTYKYDGAGRLSEVCKHQKRIEYLYDTLGRMEEMREYYGDKEGEYRSTVKKYDPLDRVIEESLCSSDGTLLHYSCYAYDYRGNQTLVQVGDQKTITEFNTHNQPCKITNALGHITHITYNTNFVNPYGQRVLQTITTDPLGYQTVDTYDTANRLVETIRLNPFGLKVGRQLLYYDICGNKKRVEEEVIEEGKVLRTIQTLFKYNAVDEVIEQVEAAGAPEQKMTRTSYNALGQKDSVIKPDGTILSYTYDSFGRLETQVSSDQTISYLYEYDSLDRLTKVTDQITGKATDLKYSAGELEKETLGNGLTLHYTYDKTGRARTVTFPDRTGVEYCYNAVDLKEIHRLINGKRTYTHRDLAHSLSGEILQEALPGENGITNYSYDPLGRCTSIASPFFNQHIPSDGFDAAGNLRTFELQNQTYAFTYDDTYQLTSETGHEKHSYQFDSLYNRTLKDDEACPYNSLNQITKTGFLYDLNGNLIERVKDHQTIRYRYDALDRLVEINQGGVATQFTYDSFNRCLSKTMNGEESLFLYQGQEEIGCWKDGRCQELRLLGKNPRHPMVAVELQGIPYVPIHDISRNVTTLLSLQGEVLENYRTTVFGETEIRDPSGKLLNQSAYGNPWQYASKRLDRESGLISFGFRMYDLSLGRWLTPDPAGYADGSNLYAYVHNSPLLYFDKNGLFSLAMNSSFQVNDSGLSFQGYEGNMNKPPETLNLVTTQINYEKYLVSKPSDSQLNWFGLTNTLLPTTFHSEQSSIFNINQSGLINPQTQSPYSFNETPGILFGGVTGICCDYTSSQNSFVHLATLANQNFVGVHSATFGPAWDLFRCITGRQRIATETVQKIHEVWYNFFKDNPNGRICWTAHSRGCIDTRNALLSFPKNLRKRISLIAVAPGCFIERFLCRDVRHLVSRGDVIPFTDLEGMLRCAGTIDFVQAGTSLLDSHTLTSSVYENRLEALYLRYSQMSY